MSLRVVYFGTPEISVAVLQALVDGGLEVAAVVTQPDRSKGRNRAAVQPPPVKLRALELGIPVLQPTSCKTPESLDILKSYEADAFCVFAFGQILPQALLDLPRYGCFNAHASLLPHLRGAAPINWAIVRGDGVTGMTIQRMVFALDAGPVCWRRECAIDPGDTAESLTHKLVPLAGEGLCAVLDQAARGSLTPVEQDHALATYAPLMKKEDGYIDWREPAGVIDRKVRGFYPWPAAHALCGAEPIRILAATPVSMSLPPQSIPGDVLDVNKSRILVACGEDALAISEVQRPGKKRLDVCAYLCGCTLAPGMRFESLVP